ncbi:hypothetical protein EOM60_02605 [Candidatus Saccharibacteria bacterium]|nr:hypothetical protein [Candidatus Saccharibacteria bacterium]
MSRNPSRYALQELIGWEDFEKLGTSILYGMGFSDIKSAGGVKDGGKDAAVYTSNEGTTVIQISQEKDPLKETKSKKKSKFWREYEKWASDKTVTKFVFVSNQPLGSKKTRLIETLRNPSVDMLGIDELVNFLDYSETGREIKKQYAIFDKDLHEVFGAEDQTQKLNDIATIINRDEHYHIDTVLASSGIQPKMPGSVFSTQDGQVIKYFTPKSYEDYLQAPAVVNVTLSGKREDVEKYTRAIRSGMRIQIPPEFVKDFKFKIGDKVFMDGAKDKATLYITPVADNEPRILILRSKEDPVVSIRSTLQLIDKTLDEVVMNNYAANEPIDVEARFSPEGQLKMNYKFQLHRCRDAVIAYQYACIFNAIQQNTVELLIDDKGIERKLIDIPMRGGEPLSEGYERLLRDMSRIQEFFKVRIPNLLAEDVQLSKNDRWSIQTLAKIIDEGKAEIEVTNLSFVLLRNDIEKLREQTAQEGAMAFGGDPKLNLLSVLGVTEFPNIELILPRTKVEVTDLGDGTAKLDVDALDKPFLRYFVPEPHGPEASWS